MPIASGPSGDWEEEGMRGMLRAIAYALAVALMALPAVAQEVRIGAFVTLSGISADVGAQMKAGMEVAIDRMAADFQVGGQHVPVRILWYDDEGKADAGLNVVTRALTVDKITAGVGFLSSDVFIRVMDEFQKAKTPVVACCAASLKIGDKIGEQSMAYVFQLSPTARDIATSVIAATATLVKPAKAAMLNENTDAGRDFSRISREWLAGNAANIEVVADEFVPRGVTDLTPQLAKFKRLGAGAIVGEIYGSSAPILYQQYNDLRVPAVIAHMGASASADTFIAEYGKLMEGSLVNVRWIPGDYTPITKPMVEAYTAKTGSSPPTFAVQAHDAVLVVLEATRAAGSLEPERIAKALEETSYVAAWGRRKFTPLAQGHRMPVATVVTQIQDGKKAVVYPADVAAKQGTILRAVPPFSWEDGASQSRSKP
jgi:branched-chain amino acid transport system substrate-binding protein